MKYSEFFLKTLKSTPKGADTIGTENLLRGGYIQQVGSGLFSYLPLGYIVLKKIENVIDEELKKEGAVNVLSPVLQPASYWKESDRYSEIGDEMMRIKTKTGEEYVLAMTAEELFSDIARNYIESYKDLPIRINQFQTKIRNEVRPKGGLMRVKEFIMQDAYSFDTNEKEMDKSYKKIFAAYERIFKKIEINFLSVEADVGAMGGRESAEFVVVCDAGEAKIVYCPKCKYKANQEVAETAVLPSEEIKKKKTKELIETPNMKTIEELSAYLKINEKDCLKTVLYQVNDQKELLMVVIRGDLKISDLII
jgi:prolyl-tRNA synthetase